MGETREELTANLRLCPLQIMTARGELGRINGADLGASRLCLLVRSVHGAGRAVAGAAACRLVLPQALARIRAKGSACALPCVCGSGGRVKPLDRANNVPPPCGKLSPPLGRTRCPKVYDGFRLRLRGRFALTGAGVPPTTTRLCGVCRLHNRSILEYNDLNQPSRVRTVRCQFPRIGK